MPRRLSNYLLPALLALLTALPAAGMVLRPCTEGALPVPAFADLSDAQPSAFSLQPSDFSLPKSSFSPANSQNCANDPVNLTDPEGAFVPLIVLGVLADMDYYAIDKAAESVDNANHGREIMTIADREYQVGLLKSGAVGGTIAIAAPYMGSTLLYGMAGYGAYSSGNAAIENYQQGNYYQAGFNAAMAPLSLFGAKSLVSSKGMGFSGTRSLGLLSQEGEAGVAALYARARTGQLSFGSRRGCVVNVFDRSNWRNTGTSKTGLTPNNYPNPDPSMDVPPVRYEPTTIDEVIRMREGKGPIPKSDALDWIEPHHRQQVPIKEGGVMDELRVRTHRMDGNHTRHGQTSSLTKRLRAQEIREHYKRRGAEYILPGEGI